MTQQVDRGKHRRRDYFAGGLTLGIALGLLFGTALGNPSIGLLVDVALGVAMQQGATL